LGKVVVERFNGQFNKYLSGDNTESRPLVGRTGQNVQYDEFDYGSTGVNSDRQQLKFNSQNQAHDGLQRTMTTTTTTTTTASGLAMKIAEKIATLQKIVLNQNVVRSTEHLNGMLNINKNVVKMSEQKFVNFYNTTMKNLNNGDLEYMYINLGKDMVYVQYKFDRIETTGSFKSNIETAKRGYFTVVLKKVNSNVTVGFEDRHHAIVRPANFEYADVDFKTEEGAETRAFDEALENQYLRVLTDAVTGEVFRFTNSGGMMAQIKNEIRKPIVMASHSTANSEAKLIDLRWEQDDLSMEMSNVGYLNAEQAAEKSIFTAMLVDRQSENSFRTRYNFTLNNLEWTSALTVVSAGNRMTARNVHCEIESIKIQVTLNKSLDRSQSYDKFNTDVHVMGLRYNLGSNNVQSELVSKVEEHLQHFIEKSLEFNFQQILRQKI
jgi:hypothetical protein